HGLNRTQAERYSRHLLLPSFGVAAQERLCRGSVLVVGCGGLGSPVAMYLAAAGVGRLGLVDHDTVDVTNLHRQVLHATSRVGIHKAVSGRITCAAINPTIEIVAHTAGFSPATALGLVDAYDVVVDASDNPATRYLVSDACVVSGKPLVSAAAVGTDGQLTVYNYGDGPCYRCLFPESPAPENCSRCGEAGVLGVVPGVMGCLQALEVIKILGRVGDVSSKKLTIFDALAGRFTTVRLRNRNPACVACGTSPAITRGSLPSYDYVAFTGQPPDDGPPEDVRLIDPRVRLEPHQRRRTTATTVFLDVRPKTQYDVMALPGVVHVPYERFEERLPEVLALIAVGGGFAPGARTPTPRVVVLCRRGNNSQRVVARLAGVLGAEGVTDMLGGYAAWAREVDPDMPLL
ncbi:hypothetical protein VOLCADRAFT_68613, partial [Volvox carteri f. nagariensis]